MYYKIKVRTTEMELNWTTSAKTKEEAVQKAIKEITKEEMEVVKVLDIIEEEDYLQ